MIETITEWFYPELSCHPEIRNSMFLSYIDEEIKKELRLEHERVTTAWMEKALGRENEMKEEEMKVPAMTNEMIKKLLWNTLGEKSLTIKELNALVGKKSLQRNHIITKLTDLFIRDGHSGDSLERRINNINMGTRGGLKPAPNVKVDRNGAITICNTRFGSNPPKPGQLMSMKKIIDPEGEQVWILKIEK